MIFDESKVFSSANADKLSKGDLVLIADTMGWLRMKVGEGYAPMTITDILSEESEYRFRVGAINEVEYALAYLICPVRNAEAYKAWKEGKPIEQQVEGNKWVGVNPLDSSEEITSDDWLQHTFRTTPSASVGILPRYRPYKNVEEFITCYKHKHHYKDNEDIMPSIWVQKKGDGYLDRFLIVGFVSTKNGEYVMFDEVLYSLSILFEQFTFLDGTPCGVLREDTV